MEMHENEAIQHPAPNDPGDENTDPTLEEERKSHADWIDETKSVLAGILSPWRTGRCGDLRTRCRKTLRLGRKIRVRRHPVRYVDREDIDEPGMEERNERRAVTLTHGNAHATAKCIDEYISQKKKEAEEGEAKQIDPRLTAVAEKMFERCLRARQFEQAIGIALESYRLDVVEEAIIKSGKAVELLDYALKVCHTLIVSMHFRHEVLKLLVKLYTSAEEPDYINICQCLMFLGDAEEVSAILDRLLKGSEEDALLAYQVAFDLHENEIQQFLLQVGELMAKKQPQEPSAEEGEGGMDTGDGNQDTSSSSNLLSGRYTKLRDIISGATPIKLHLEFLYNHNHADLQILKNIKGAIETRNSVCHSGTICANALMHAGTTVDTFLRENLEWLSRATNWAKFSATAALGVIHKGHLEQGQSLMAPYLPRDGASGSPFSEGGALYALGLIHTGHGSSIRRFLLDSLRSASNETIQHGACLGLGLASLGAADEEVYEDLKGTLYADSAVAGEASGIALGLLMVGTAHQGATELLAYAHDTQHEKIIRGIALGLALSVYGQEEDADTLIEQMTSDADPIMRYGGMQALGMAYCGSGNNSAIRRLLHFAVSDVSDDVRRAAVMFLGFVLCSAPEECPRIVSLLAESYNPHLRYGAAMAVGISCAGVGTKAALELLEPLLSDAVDFVRQGALLAKALVLIQQPESIISSFRKHLEKVIGDKHEDALCKLGAILATGILDAGGRNVTIRLHSHSRYPRMEAIVGMAVFTQYWYWFPLTFFLSLALSPTALIGLNADLKVPKLQVQCNCKASLFAYPKSVATESKVTVAKAPTAVLSTTAKMKARKEKEAKKQEEGKPAEHAEAVGTDEAMETDDQTLSDEPGTHMLDNPARVVPEQEKYIAFPQLNARFVPLKSSSAGIVMLKDLRPGEPVELVASEAPNAQAGNAGSNGDANPAEDEPEPPQPFEYVPPS